MFRGGSQVCNVPGIDPAHSSPARRRFRGAKGEGAFHFVVFSRLAAEGEANRSGGAGANFGGWQEQQQRLGEIQWRRHHPRMTSKRRSRTT